MPKKKVIHQTETNQIDHETGQILNSSDSKTYMVESEPNYIKLYIEDIGKLNDLSPSASKVLMSLVGAMGYNGVIPIYFPIKKMIAKDLNITVNTINKAIDTLNKKGILIRKDRGLYIADPTIFAKGSWENVRKIRATIEYSSEGRKIVNTEKFDEQLKLIN